MKTTFTTNQKTYEADLTRPIDLTLPFSNEGPRAWGSPPPIYLPLSGEGWTGSVEAGFSVNFFKSEIITHGQGTHTECLGHITKQVHNLQEVLPPLFQPAVLISLTPDQNIITEKLLAEKLSGLPQTTAILVRTLPNAADKKSKNYSGMNPPFFSESAIEFLVERGVEHLLCDLPSVDPEEDGGALLAHRAFWQVDQPHPRKRATITELIYAPDEAKDGLYLLNMQVAPVEGDAAPSRIVIFSAYEKTT